MYKFTPTAEFERFIASMYIYKPIYNFLKLKIGPDCARKIINEYHKSSKYGHITTIEEWNYYKNEKREYLEKMQLRQINKISGRNLRFLDTFMKIHTFYYSKYEKTIPMHKKIYDIYIN